MAVSQDGWGSVHSGALVCFVFLCLLWLFHKVVGVPFWGFDLFCVVVFAAKYILIRSGPCSGGRITRAYTPTMTAQAIYRTCCPVHRL